MQKDIILQCSIQIICSIVCSAMAFFGTFYASTSALKEIHISEYNNRHRQIFEKKIDEYSKFYSLALQEIDLSNMTMDGIRKNIEILKSNYKKVEMSCTLLSVLCSYEETLAVKKVAVIYSSIYAMFLKNFNKLNETQNSQEILDIKKDIITQYHDKMYNIREDLQKLEDVMRKSTKNYINS